MESKLIKFPEELIREIEQFAKANYLNFSSAVRFMCGEFLAQRDINGGNVKQYSSVKELVEGLKND